jgi:hypothetical protein
MAALYLPPAKPDSKLVYAENTIGTINSAILQTLTNAAAESTMIQAFS